MSTKAKMSQIDATEVRFYVADDFREEASNKVTAIGLYADNRIVLQMPASQPDPTAEYPAAIRSLCFLFNVSEAPEAAKVSIEIEGPVTNGAVFPEQVLQGKVMLGVSSGVTSNIIVRMDPCIVTALGKRTFTVKVNQRQFKFDYVVNRYDPAQPVVPDQPVAKKAASIEASPKKSMKKKVSITTS